MSEGGAGRAPGPCMLEAAVAATRTREGVGPDDGSLWAGFLSWDSQTWGDFRAQT